MIRKVILFRIVALFVAYFGFTFTASAADSITLSEPDPGDTITRGSSYTIRWSSIGSFSNVRIQFKSGSSYTDIVSSTSNDGSYTWNVPSNGIIGSNLGLRISDVNRWPTVYDLNEPITIASGTPSGTVSITEPDPGEVLTRGTSFVIKWNSTGSISNVRIQLKQGSGYTDIVSSTGNDGSYTWSIPSDGVIGGDFEIRVSDTRNWGGAYDLSGLITIVSGTSSKPDLIVRDIEVDNSSSTRTYTVGETVRVECEVFNQGSGSAESSSLGYYFASSRNDTSDRWESDGVSSLDAGEGGGEYENYTFTQSDVGTRYFVLKADRRDDVTNEVSEGNNITSFGPFTVVEAQNVAPSITVNEPSSAISVIQGADVDISWDGTDPDDAASVDIAYDPDNTYNNGNETWLSLDQNEDGSITWDTTTITPGSYYILGLISDGDGSDYNYASGTVTIEDASLEDADILSWNVPTDETSPGTQHSFTVRFKNSGNVTRSFWMGFSLESPSAGAWPEGWLDIDPVETPVLAPDEEYEHTFYVKLPFFLENGSYEAHSAIWSGYDAGQNEMIAPSFDKEEKPSFTINTALLPSDPYGIRALDPNAEECFDNISNGNRSGMPDLEARANGIHPLRVSNKSGKTLDTSDKNLVILTHGWTDRFCVHGSPSVEETPSLFYGQMNYLYNEMMGSGLIIDDWSVIRYDWSHDARTSVPSDGLDLSSGKIPFRGNQETTPALCSIELNQAAQAQSDVLASGSVPLPYKILKFALSTQSSLERYATIAAERAYQHGLLLGRLIEDDVGTSNLERVHLVGHSAGAWLIYGAARYLDHNCPNVELQITYLDPFIPDEGINYPGFIHHPFMTSARLENSIGLCTPNANDTFKADAYYTENDSTEGLFNWISDATTVKWDWDPATDDAQTLFVGHGELVGDFGGHTGPVKFYAKSVQTLYRIDGEDLGWRRSMEYNTVFNSAPTDIALDNSSVAENESVGITVGELSTIDPDTGDSFGYELTSGSGDTDNTLFDISGSDLVTKVSFNHELKDTRSVRITATDDGGLSTEKEFTINIVDVNESPTALGISNSEINENNSVGEIVGVFSTTDPDDGDSFTYEFATGSGDSGNSFFDIDESNLVAKTKFNHESVSSYSVRLIAFDSEGLSTEDSFAISVLDLNERPTALYISNDEVLENLPAGTEVGTLSSSDPDDGHSGDVFTYALVSGIGDDDNTHFDIVDNYLRTDSFFDYETKDRFLVRIRTQDPGGLNTEEGLVVTILDMDDQPICQKPEILGNQITLRWTSFFSQEYSVLWSTNLINGFIPLVENIEATPPQNERIIDTSGKESMFLKVQVEE